MQPEEGTLLLVVFAREVERRREGERSITGTPGYVALPGPV